jgi:hypothetical protein
MAMYAMRRRALDARLTRAVMKSCGGRSTRASTSSTTAGRQAHVDAVDCGAWAFYVTGSSAAPVRDLAGRSTCWA